MTGYVTAALSKVGRIHAMLFLPVLPVFLCGCDVLGECSPHLEETLVTSDKHHTAQRWIAICGAPGATVTDIITVTSAAVISPGEEGFSFNEEPSRNAAGSSISIAWIDSNHLKIQVNEIGDIRSSPRQMDSVDLVYVLAPEVDLKILKDQIYQKSDDRHQLERMKSSRSWYMVESLYDSDKYIIDRAKRFINWVESNIGADGK